jgi:hypothetical protein
MTTVQDVHRPESGEVLPAQESEALLHDVGHLGEELLQVGLHPVLLQARVAAQLVGGVADDLVQVDGHQLALLVADLPPVGEFRDLVRGVHPVERLVCAAVGVDRHASVSLDHDEARRLREPRLETARVDHAAPGDDEPHMPMWSRIRLLMRSRRSWSWR